MRPIEPLLTVQQAASAAVRDAGGEPVARMQALPVLRDAPSLLAALWTSGLTLDILTGWCLRDGEFRKALRTRPVLKELAGERPEIQERIDLDEIAAIAEASVRDILSEGEGRAS